MIARPKILEWLSILFAVLGLAMPTQALWLSLFSDLSLDAIMRIVRPTDLVISLGLILNAFWIREAAPQCRWSLPVVLGVLAWATTMTSGPWVALSFALVQVPLLNPEIMNLWRDPNRRWWRAAERKSVHLPVNVLGVGSPVRLEGESFDLSLSGMFFPTQQRMISLLADQRVTVQMKLTSGSIFECNGLVVRQAAPRGRYPAGLGIHFVGLTIEQKLALKRELDRT